MRMTDAILYIGVHDWPTHMPCPLSCPNFLQIFEEEVPVVADGNDECSSYATYNSNDEELEKPEEAPGEGVLDTLRTLRASNATMVASIATMVDSHGTVIEKLGLMEKAVVNAQLDMKAVHDAIVQVAENVIELTDFNAQMVRHRGVPCARSTQKEAWKGKALVDEGGNAPPCSTPQGKIACTPEENNGKNGSTFPDGGYIAETQNQTNYAERLSHIASSPEDESVSDREAEYAAALGQSSPRDTEARGGQHVDGAEEESQQLALSCPSAQPRTPAAGAKMWTDFRRAVQMWPPPGPQGHGREDGWVSAKRGRGASPDSEEDTMDTSNVAGVGENSALNLNEPPEKHVPDQAAIVREQFPGNAETSNHKRGGGGRGGARGRRPPRMQPGYHSMVSWIA